MHTTKYKLLSLVMAACFLFLVLTILAMFFYPGGTRSNPDTQGYHFFENFFSEMGLTQTYAGETNTVSFTLFTVGLALAGTALALYFCIAPSLFWELRITRISSLIGSTFGFISGLSFMGVAFTPANLYLVPHRLFVQLAFVAFFVAVIFYTLAIFLYRSYPNLYAWVYISFGVLLGSYIWLFFFGPATTTPNGLLIQVTGQKIIAYAAILCMFIQAYGSRSVLATKDDEDRHDARADQISTAS